MENVMTEIVQPTPKYLQLKELLKRGIASGDYAVNSPLPTQRVLMERYRLSFSTVRRALEDLVREGVAYSRPGKGIYVVDPAKAAAGKKRVLTIFGARQEWFSERPRGCIAGLLKAQHDFEFLMRISEGQSLVEVEADLRAGKRPSDGAIVPYFAGQIERLVAAMNEVRFPYVILDVPNRRSDVNAVIIDHEAGAFDVVTHLIRRGYRRIAYVGGAPGEEACYAWATAKHDGYLRALKTAGLTPSSEDTMIIDDFQESLIPDYVKHIIRGLSPGRRGDVTAAFIAIEPLARAALAGLVHSGVRVPQDVAIVGFNRGEPDAPGLPTLTTVDIPMEDAGAEAVKMLLAQIDGREPFPAQRILRGRLIVGQSSGAVSA